MNQTNPTTKNESDDNCLDCARLSGVGCLACYMEAN